ncbi:hypothetical protein INR49_003361 [Caranx melampygus]|nr:hypothetical protein INR49_003361 [Caranx melampygus]
MLFIKKFPLDVNVPSTKQDPNAATSGILISVCNMKTMKIAGGICLNGGSSVPSLSSGEHMFCLCADGFEGRRCEKVKGPQCYIGIGLSYRGSMSKSESGRTCEVWDLDTRGNTCHQTSMEGGTTTAGIFSTENVHGVTCRVDLWPADQEKQMKIVGGTVATVESHPWQIKGQGIPLRGQSDLCLLVLTAAHCFPDGSQTKQHRFSVTLGKNAINETDRTVEQTFRVEKIIIHEGFDNSEGNFNNDIALLKLKAKQGRCAEESRSVRTVCLPPAHQNLQPGVTCEIAGYGKEKQGLWYRSQYLREAQVNLLADELCQHSDYYGKMITDNMFCAGRPDWSQDACEVGNRLFQFGVISWGDGCAKEFRPGVYTRVTNYNRWIEEKTGVSSNTTLPQEFVNIAHHLQLVQVREAV